MICVWLTKDGGDEIIINYLIDFVRGSNFALYTLPTLLLLTFFLL